MTRTIWFSIDNMFRIEVEDDATDEQITDAMYSHFGEILMRYGASDFDFVIEEDHTEP